RRIARELRVDRSTVKRYAGAAKSASNPTTGSATAKPATACHPTTGSDASWRGGEWLAKPATNPTTGSRPGPPSRCEGHRAFIEQSLAAGLSLQRIHQ